MIDKLRKLTGRDFYVTADPGDSSVTLSRDLVRSLRLGSLSEARVMVVRLGAGGDYAFVLNPGVGRGAALADLQYNSKHNCIGFECGVPTVSRILYDYGLGAGEAVRLRVRRGVAGDGVVFYRICRP